MDKIGEVIGPKGKVINLIQQETGADVNVDDDGVVGTVTIGSKDGEAVAEAKRRIEQILDPPRAEIGAVYPGKVVNITKFGAFVNILPGRDGLLHISKMGGGRRINQVEDVLTLGQEIDVKVDDIDPQGKVSLSVVTPLVPEGGDAAPAERSERPERGDRPERGERSERSAPAESAVDAPIAVSFESEFEAEVASEFGDLGPADEAPAGGGDDRPRRNRRRR
jgi:polyribonucleotide nucleotidyltransferase